MNKSTLGWSKVTRSGQITLNRKVRKELGVELGDYVLFEKIEGDKLYILPAEVKIKKRDKQNW
jgi:AbrB family looped-hinge helix DNA binding protein